VKSQGNKGAGSTGTENRSKTVYRSPPLGRMKVDGYIIYVFLYVYKWAGKIRGECAGDTRAGKEKERDGLCAGDPWPSS
jgi:hypothetical protein